MAKHSLFTKKFFKLQVLLVISISFSVFADPLSTEDGHKKRAILSLFTPAHEINFKGYTGDELTNFEKTFTEEKGNEIGTRLIKYPEISNLYFGENEFHTKRLQDLYEIEKIIDTYESLENILQITDLTSLFSSADIDLIKTEPSIFKKLLFSQPYSDCIINVRTS